MKSLVNWEDNGSSDLPIGLWQECTCTKEAVKKVVVNSPTVADSKEVTDKATLAGSKEVTDKATVADNKTVKNNVSKEEEKGEKKMENNGKPMANFGDLSSMFKANGFEAAKRVASTQAIKALRAAIVKGLESQGGDTAAQAALFLSTPYGEALLAMIGGIGLQQIGIPGVSDNVRGAIAQELRVQGMALAGNELASQFAGPLTEALASLAGPMEQVRVAMENETKGAMEAPPAENHELELAETAKARLRSKKNP